MRKSSQGLYECCAIVLARLGRWVSSEVGWENRRGSVGDARWRCGGRKGVEEHLLVLCCHSGSPRHVGE